MIHHLLWVFNIQCHDLLFSDTHLSGIHSANILSHANKAYLNRIQPDEKQVVTFKGG